MLSKRTDEAVCNGGCVAPVLWCKQGLARTSAGKPQSCERRRATCLTSDNMLVKRLMVRRALFRFVMAAHVRSIRAKAEGEVLFVVCLWATSQKAVL